MDEASEKPISIEELAALLAGEGESRVAQYVANFFDERPDATISEIFSDITPHAQPAMPVIEEDPNSLEYEFWLSRHWWFDHYHPDWEYYSDRRADALLSIAPTTLGCH